MEKEIITPKKIDTPSTKSSKTEKRSGILVIRDIEYMCGLLNVYLRTVYF